MSTALTVIENTAEIAHPVPAPTGTREADASRPTGTREADASRPRPHFSFDVELCKSTFCKGATDEEFALFLYQCERTRLDPFTKQIYAVMRWDSKASREVLTTQVSIDGLRLIADRTQCYAPWKATRFTYDEQNRLLAATAYVKKYVHGEWHQMEATAYYDEQAPLKNGQPTGLWAAKPLTMLEKCAESKLLRKAFPMDLSGLYIPEELQQEGADE